METVRGAQLVLRQACSRHVWAGGYVKHICVFEVFKFGFSFFQSLIQEGYSTININNQVDIG